MTVVTGNGAKGVFNPLRQVAPAKVQGPTLLTPAQEKARRKRIREAQRARQSQILNQF